MRARASSTGPPVLLLLVGAGLIAAGAEAPSLGAQEPAGRSQATISTRLDTTRVNVGDRLVLEVSVEHSAEAAVAWPDSPDLDPFEVLQTRIAPTRTGDGTAVSAATFSLAAFELGELEIPSFEVTLLHPDGSEEALTTDRYGVEVVSVGVDEGGDIREIRGPLAIPLGALRVLAWLVLLLAVAGAAFLVGRRLRSGDDGPEALRPPEPPRPAHEVALEALDRLESSSLLAEGRVKEYHIRVSEIVRRYVETRFRVRALEMTTWEVLGGLQAAGVDEALRSDLRRFLDQCDLVKFAKAEPDDAASRAVLVLGRELVERSMPEPEPVEA